MLSVLHPTKVYRDIHNVTLHRFHPAIETPAIQAVNYSIVVLDPTIYSSNPNHEQVKAG